MPIANVVNLTATSEPSPTTFRSEQLLATTNPDQSRALESLGVEGSEEARLDADVTVIEVVILTGERRAF